MARVQAASRNSEIASRLESFLDDNVDYLSPSSFRDLDELAGELDDMVDTITKDHDDTVNELESRISELEEKIKELEENQ